MCASLQLQPAPVVHSVDKRKILCKTPAVEKPRSLNLVRRFLAVTTQLKASVPRF